jgi:8-oxo-dGTP pyrophosphatase MutT (NUDIX family)
MSVPQPIPARPTARVLALDSAGRVLLLCHVDKRRAWIAPGGAVEAGESSLATAVRELAEETGLAASAADLVSPVLRQRVLWSAGRATWLAGDDTFFVLRTDPFGTYPAERTPLEVSIIGESRWWSPADIRAATEPVFPEGLADLLEALARDRTWVDAVAVDRVVEAA